MTSYIETGFGPTDKHERRKVLEDLIPAVTAVFAKHGIQIEMIEADLGFQLALIFNTPDGRDSTYWAMPFYDHMDQCRIGEIGQRAQRAKVTG